MINFVNSIISNTNLPILIAFLLGILMAISPCPLTTNIAAIAYLSKKATKVKEVIWDGFFYTLGRLIGYTSVATLIYFGLSGFQIGRFLESWGTKILGPVLIFIALSMFGLVRIDTKLTSNKFFNKIKEKIDSQGYWGVLLLGILFSLAFCPYSGVLFFAILIPMVLTVPEGLLLAPVFAIGTGLPVIFFSIIIIFSFNKLNKFFNTIKKAEKIIRYAVASVFLGSGLYYTYFLIKFLNNLLIK